jgi:hypothetical protein
MANDEKQFDHLLENYVNDKSRDNTINSNRANSRNNSALPMKKKASIADVKQKLKEKVKSRIPNVLDARKRKKNRNANV